MQNPFQKIGGARSTGGLRTAICRHAAMLILPHPPTVTSATSASHFTAWSTPDADPTVHGHR